MKSFLSGPANLFLIGLWLLLVMTGSVYWFSVGNVSPFTPHVSHFTFHVKDANPA
jgi:hypothetical protein